MPISTIGTDGLSTSPTLTTPKATTTIGVGNATPAASGSGVTFPATQSASSDANTLDDYEEGTWTPSLNPSGGTSVSFSYGSRSAWYTRVGNIVTVGFDLNATITYSSAPSRYRVDGLPFTQSSTSYGSYCVLNNSTGGGFIGRLSPSTALLEQLILGVGSGTTVDLWGSATYQV